MIAPFRSELARLARWALAEEEHANTDNWQIVLNGDDSIGGGECMYGLRRLAHLAIR